jgi:putative FmdB family regulatory protein
MAPLYDFTCDHCDDTQEIQLPFDHGGDINCGHCGNKLVKVWPTPGIQFKGDGWASKS